jgi:hypothetical protein
MDVKRMFILILVVLMGGTAVYGEVESDVDAGPVARAGPSSTPRTPPR